PAVMITGPRSTGKTTTAERVAASVVHLDRPAEAEAFRADPDAEPPGGRRGRVHFAGGTARAMVQ
ncbi:MAG TPA: hypothetical protein VEJ84_11490, partial [Acidimicrobiales bacterium]|nr:hypothetical protein [Acidimicrobiales bacterium]